ncbi:acyltransferase family protein [Corynebacterium breve]|uniref:Acyltransferase family protein n=1 Tax=Corynebacterium breve TaxID=3049799 RepID=A0ABY8VH90_9CORY|nr:acyltransferase family protein [Corynebacterium breve]WIM66905.1 acyltransferase family protein [Corynebacterium breve]
MTSKPTSTTRSSTYRYDLDGLRGYAIALVVLFHVFVGRVSGGVDVFLLLSGYFFLGSQLRYAMRRGASLNPWWPIWRTMRRLLPALAVVIAATFVLALVFAPQLIAPELTTQLTAAVLYYLNWELMAQDAAYSAASVDTSPLQHLWSMSVQGQFYLFAILFALAVAWFSQRKNVPDEKVRRASAIILGVITVASFVYASRYGIIGTADNYYSLFSRMWEMTLGAVLALVVYRVTVPKRIAPWTSLLGVVMITITGFVITTSLAFPGPLALLPLTGAVLVIISSGDHWMTRMLGSKSATWLGDIAYSLYLWHWPLLIITTAMTVHNTPPVWLGVLVVVASLVLAHFTHKYVEAPLRQHAKRPTTADQPVQRGKESLRTVVGKRRAAGGAVVAALLLGILSIQPVWAARTEHADDALDPARYPGLAAQFGAHVPRAKAEPDPSLIAGIYPPISEMGCMSLMYDDTEQLQGPECWLGDVSAEQTVVLVGGSHAETWGMPLDQLGREHGFRVIPFIRQDCPMVLDDMNEIILECAQWNDNVLQALLDIDPDLVVSNSTRPGGEIGQGPDIVPVGYTNFWNVLNEHQIPFLGLRDNPWFFDPEGLPRDPNHCMIEFDDMEECSMPLEKVYAPQDPAAPILAEMPLATSVDTVDWFCTDGLCPPVIGNIYVYRDTNHLSNAFAESTAETVWEHVGPILGQSSKN